jgi:putative membrane protein
MKALRLILFGVVLALFILFAYSNWTPVDIILPNGSTAKTSLPVIVFVAFLLGWLPVLLLHLASRASWRRRTAKVERLLDDALLTGPRVASPSPTTAFPPVP